MVRYTFIARLTLMVIFKNANRLRQPAPGGKIHIIKGNNVGQSKTTIELNGKMYDATTGVSLQPGEAAPLTPRPAKASSGITMDGFFRRPNVPKPVTTPVAAKKPAAPRTHSAAQAAARKPEKAKTLMRHVVHKPKAPLVNPVAQTSKTKSAPVAAPGAALESRRRRAAHIPKSSSVSRFAVATRPSIDKKVVPLPVKQHPSDTKPAPVATKSASSKPSSSADSFNKALENASSHRQAPLKAKTLRHRTAQKLGVSSRAVSIASISLVVVLLTGFVAYQNVPNASMRLAATRAGFSGKLPGYTPGGFSLSGPIKSSPGAIIVSFKSNSDNRSFNLTQKPSDWTSESLRNNFFGTGDNPTAFQDKGKTIYTYNNGSSAVWVNAGVMYQVTGNANLNNDQVTSIADSL